MAIMWGVVRVDSHHHVGDKKVGRENIIKLKMLSIIVALFTFLGLVGVMCLSTASSISIPRSQTHAFISFKRLQYEPDSTRDHLGAPRCREETLKNLEKNILKVHGKTECDGDGV